MLRFARHPLRPRSHAVRVLTVLFLLAARRPARATIYDVDRTDDDATQTACTAAANDCSLRGAIIAANVHPGADVINLQATTYDLTTANPTNTHEDAAATGDLDITDDLTINGVSAATTIIDGQQHDRIFHTNPGEQNKTITIQDVTIRNGHSPQIAFVTAEGGGVRNGATSPSGVNPVGTLHLVRVIVTGNSAEKAGGGISNDGTMTIVDSVVSNNTTSAGTNGGGIVQDDEGSLTITGTTIIGNDATAGGGFGGGLWTGFFSIGANPLVTIDSSTISGNQAKLGGGIARNRGNVTVTNSTISGNTSTQASAAGGGGISDSGSGLAPMLLLNCTVSNNTANGTSTGGGIQNNGATTGIETKLVNTIVAGNHAGSGIDIAGSMLSGGHNLIGDATAIAIDPTSDTTGDIMGVSAGNLHLGALAPNGGLTMTQALHFGSPALDAGNPAAPGSGGSACPSVDQRGQSRPVDGDGSGSARCDIGAFESEVVPASPTPTVTPSATRTATATPTPTKTATPVAGTRTPTPAATPIQENCGNCVDDDGDGLVDEDDPNCPQPSDGGAQGLGDAARAKRLLKCAGAIQKAGTKLEGKHLARLQKCLATAFGCTQLKNGDAKCSVKARATCDKAFAARAGDAAKVAATLAKACGASAVDPDDLTGPTGLGYGGHASLCTPAPVDATTLAACVAEEHACRADALLGVQVPRAGELLTLAGHDAAELPCLAAFPGSGAGLGDVKRAKPIVKCQQAIEKAGAKLVSAELKLVPKCANAVLACVQLAKDGCAPKSRATCAKTGPKVNALAAKLAAAVKKTCAKSDVTLLDALDPDGVGLGYLAPACAAADVAPLGSIGPVNACLTKYHECRAHQLLENQIPRLRELLGIGQLALP